MASVVNEGGGRRMIQLSPGEHADRPRIRFGKASARQAATAKLHVEKLVAAKGVGGALEPETVAWLNGLPPAIRRRLERIGLLSARARGDVPTLGDWLRTYTGGRGDVKAATQTVYGHTRRNLLAFFGAGKRLEEITRGDVDAFRVYLTTGEKLAENTARRRIRIARQFFRAAIRRKLLADNPFDGQSTSLFRNRKREYFVSRAQAESILNACPDPRWRLVFALCRWGGLRCSSEIVALKWPDVDWERMRLTVHATKTERRDGAGVRQLPIFEELYPHLLAAYEAAEPGAVYCCPQYDNANQMYRKGLLAMLRAARVEAWPKLAQNCRASRESELVAEHPLHVVCEWLGNSPVVAAQHYLQTTDADFERAAAKPLASGAKSGADSGASHSELGRTAPQAGAGGPQESPVLLGVSHGAGECGAVQNAPVGRSGLEPLTSCVSSRRSIHLS